MFINKFFFTKKYKFSSCFIWYLYILPMASILLLVFGYSIVSVIENSFYAGNISHLVPVGAQNYTAVFHSENFWVAIENNLKFLLCVPIMSAIALPVSIILYEQIKGWRFYRFVIFMPYIVSPVIIGITFSNIYQYDGVMNSILRSFGLNSFALDWLGNSNVVIPSIMSVIIWQQVGFGVVLFLARLLNLPIDLYEAAELDGANWWQKHWSITIPQMKGIIEFFIIIEIINMLSWVFNYVYVLTRGGPGGSSNIMELFIWRNAFKYNSYGEASVVATLLLIITSILIFFYFYVSNRNLSED